ncbi:MAG: chemotaxis response regulator protein-glutamate methylesterase [Leptospiraceae bacterium]|nr:chemotaxis response regulator protein-glutamate methylesterase [Leptospiraceae bacterium]
MSLQVLLVDDSRLVRVAVRDILESIPGVQVFGEARHGQECLDLLASSSQLPDVIILDVEMPVMDGIATLKEIRKRGLPVKVLMLSVLTIYGALTTFRAMDLGAIDFLPKPSPDSGLTFADISELLRLQVQGLLDHHSERAQVDPQTVTATPRVVHDRSAAPAVVVIGISTGGPPALQKVLERLPADYPLPILVVQHMPPVFTRAFADRLDSLCKVRVVEAVQGQSVEPATVYITPGDYHMELEGSRTRCRIVLTQAPERNSHRPSADVSMEHVARIFGPASLGIIMTGMGRDGVAGMQALHAAGARTLAQDEASSVIFGMNKRAIEAGVVDDIVPLDQMADRLMQEGKAG